MAQRWTLPELEARVLSVLRGVLHRGTDLTLETDLVDAGLDSLAFTQLLLAIEESTGAWLDEAELTPANMADVKSIAACFHRQLRVGNPE